MTQRLNYSRQDKLGRVALAFDRFLDKLQPTLNEVQNASGAICSAAGESANISEHTNTRIHHHQDMDPVAAAVEQISASARAVAQSPIEASDAAFTADEASRDGLSVIESTSHSMSKLELELQGATSHIHQLASNSNHISAVLDVIRSLAEHRSRTGW